MTNTWNEIERGFKEVFTEEHTNIPDGGDDIWREMRRDVAPNSILAFFKDRTTPKKSGRKTKKKPNLENAFKNQYGSLPAGTRVSFEMENADMWAGDTVGILVFVGGKWKIQTERSGLIGIGGYLEAYPNTITPQP